MRLTTISSLVGIVATTGLLAACQVDEIGYGAKHLRPLGTEVKGTMAKLRMRPGSPILLRIFKQESELEIWKRDHTGRFALLKTFPICKWSGKLGPKFKEGDRQAPEGFYDITPALMNPRSSYHLAFNLGYPNAFDRAHNRTGKHLMVHGACSSRGCYAMSNPQIEEIYTLARESFRGGQRSFQVQAYPFRMTGKNMAKYASHPDAAFWRMIKKGNDHFLISKLPPKIDICNKGYVFNAQLDNDRTRFRSRAACPKYTVPEALALAVAEKETRDNSEMRLEVARLEKERIAEEERKRTEIAKAKREEEFARKSKAILSSFLPGSSASEPIGRKVRARKIGGKPVPIPSPRKRSKVAGKKSGSWFSSLFSSE